MKNRLGETGLLFFLLANHVYYHANSTKARGICNQIGSDIDIFEDSVHAIIESTISKARAFQVEHELLSMRNHLFAAA